MLSTLTATMDRKDGASTESRARCLRRRSSRVSAAWPAAATRAVCPACSASDAISSRVSGINDVAEVLTAAASRASLPAQGPCCLGEPYAEVTANTHWLTTNMSSLTADLASVAGVARHRDARGTA